MQSAASDLPLIEEAARAAGDIARRAFGGKFKAWTKSPDQPVTEIDLAVNEELWRRLRGARPDYGWLSEETADSAERQSKSRVWIIDPIDGTRAFINGEPQFTISIGLVENGRAVAGGVYNPIRDRMYLGAEGAGATLNGEPMRASERGELDGARILMTKQVYERVRRVAPWPKVELSARASIAYRLSLVAAGKFDAAVLVGFKNEWDVAGGAAIIAAAGGRIADTSGAPLRFNQENPRHPGVVASGAALYPLLIERTSHIPAPSDAPARPEEAPS